MDAMQVNIHHFIMLLAMAMWILLTVEYHNEHLAQECNIYAKLINRHWSINTGQQKWKHGYRQPSYYAGAQRS
eukprot:m.212246 g.212246  ORF g.212246 m.212246 type:complete len:73 (+) comp39772_c0_seq9:1104-1322(+)